MLNILLIFHSFMNSHLINPVTRVFNSLHKAHSCIIKPTCYSSPFWTSCHPHITSFLIKCLFFCLHQISLQFHPSPLDLHSIPPHWHNIINRYCMCNSQILNITTMMMRIRMILYNLHPTKQDLEDKEEDHLGGHHINIFFSL